MKALDARYAALTWPARNDEDWKRSPFEAGILDTFEPYGRQAEAVAPETPPPPDGSALRAIFVRGRLTALEVSPEAAAAGIRAEPFSSLEEYGGERLSCLALGSPDKAAALSWARLTHGLRIVVPRGSKLDAPIFVELREGGAKALAAPRIVFELGPMSSAKALIRLCSADSAPTQAQGAGATPETCAVSGGVAAFLEESSRLDLTLIQTLDRASLAALWLDAEIGKDAIFDWYEFHAGSSRVRTRSSARLLGQGARADLDGAWVAAAGDVVDASTLQAHEAPNATSDALYKGAVASKGRSSYRGLITVSREAVKTDAYLANRNLLLGPEARADSLPTLAIGTNDVRCTHGSTTGRIDPEQLFYLESRGIARAKASQMIADGFVGQIADRVPDPFRDFASEALDARMALAAGTS